MEIKEAHTIIDGLDVLGRICHEASVANGWWQDKDGNDIGDNPFVKATKLGLIISEVVEAMEGERKDLMDTHLTYRKMVEVELADVVIRLMDYARKQRLDIAGACIDKLAYNAGRADHKKENREAVGGKKF